MDDSDLDTHSPPPVVTAVPVNLGFAALNRASMLVHASPSIPPSLDDVIAREESYARRLEQQGLDRSRPKPLNDDALMATGPVQAILLDPLLTNFTGDRRVARVEQILYETKPGPFLREVGPLLLSIVGMCGIGALLMAGLIPPLVAIPGALVLAYSMMIPRRRGAYMRGPRNLVIPVRYPPITRDDALQLAALTPKLWQQIEPGSTRTIPPVPKSQPVTDQTTPSHAYRRRKIAEVHAAISELDVEWLEYQLDLHAWFLAKPQLRNLNDPIIKAYREADAELRDLADDLTDTSSDEQITAAQDAARRALKAWGSANRHALAIGVTNLSPSEEAALQRLHGLVGQLNDRATPKAMWPQLINTITRTMTRLTTAPCTLADIAKLPVIESESRLRAIEQNPAVEQAR